MVKPTIPHEEMVEAVREGVRQGVCDLGSSHGQYDIPHELFYEAVRQGVRDAMWQMITHATQMPCADFYQTIRDGVEAAMKDLAPDEHS